MYVTPTQIEQAKAQLKPVQDNTKKQDGLIKLDANLLKMPKCLNNHMADRITLDLLENIHATLISFILPKDLNALFSKQTILDYREDALEAKDHEQSLKEKTDFFVQAIANYANTAEPSDLLTLLLQLQIVLRLQLSNGAVDFDHQNKSLDANVQNKLFFFNIVLNAVEVLGTLDLYNKHVAPHCKAEDAAHDALESAQPSAEPKSDVDSDHDSSAASESSENMSDDSSEDELGASISIRYTDAHERLVNALKEALKLAGKEIKTTEDLLPGLNSNQEKINAVLNRKRMLIHLKIAFIALHQLKLTDDTLKDSIITHYHNFDLLTKERIEQNATELMAFFQKIKSILTPSAIRVLQNPSTESELLFSDEKLFKQEYLVSDQCLSDVMPPSKDASHDQSATDHTSRTPPPAHRDADSMDDMSHDVVVGIEHFDKPTSEDRRNHRPTLHSDYHGDVDVLSDITVTGVAAANTGTTVSQQLQWFNRFITIVTKEQTRLAVKVAWHTVGMDYKARLIGSSLNLLQGLFSKDNGQLAAKPEANTDKLQSVLNAENQKDFFNALLDLKMDTTFTDSNGKQQTGPQRSVKQALQHHRFGGIFSAANSWKTATENLREDAGLDPKTGDKLQNR